MKKDLGKKWLCTGIHSSTFFSKVKTIHFSNLRGKSPLENELQLYPSAIHPSSKD